jgi:hypothetical protein
LREEGDDFKLHNLYTLSFSNACFIALSLAMLIYYT